MELIENCLVSLIYALSSDDIDRAVLSALGAVYASGEFNSHWAINQL